jgi:uncharacterized damage-inducible protein DinB
MNLEDVYLLFRFNRWANSVMAHAASFLTEEQLKRNLNSSFGSVRDTMVHMMWGEWLWLRRWKEEHPMIRFNPAEFNSLDEIRKRWAQIEMERTAFVSTLNDADLSRQITYVNSRAETWTYSLSHMIQHIVNHSSYHRGQVMGMLRQLGVHAASNDFLNFIDIVQASKR